MHSVELGPVADGDRTQRPVDLFLIFAGANIVATTLQVGAALTNVPWRWALAVIVAGSLGGALLVALLAPVGVRLGVPSIVACRAALGFRGAQLVAAVLFLSNFIWIALNNVIAGSIASRLAGDGAQAGAWAVALGLVATLVVACGPRVAAYADRGAVPLLCAAGVVYTAACLRLPWPEVVAQAPMAGDVMRGFDVVFGYQTSWLLMFGDYSRYSRSSRPAAGAVFAGLGLSAVWFIPLGLLASSLARSSDPGAMVEAAGIGWWGGALVALATLTTNFVNIYMSALALRSLHHAVTGAAAVAVIGGVGCALSLLSATWLDQFANFTLLLAGVFVPVGGVLLAHFVIRGHEGSPAALYRRTGDTPHADGVPAWSAAGLIAWLAGGAAFYVARPLGGVLPGLCVSVLVYLIMASRTGPRASARGVEGPAAGLRAPAASSSQ